MTHAAALGFALAQLDPTTGSALPRGTVPSAGEAVLVTLPASFGIRQRVVAHHGTEIYKLAEWSAACTTHEAKPMLAYVEAVTAVERRDLVYVMHTMSGPREFPLECRLSAVRGRFTLVFHDPGRPRSPALASRVPDYVVP
jgi:hypothetical protein